VATFLGVLRRGVAQPPLKNVKNGGSLLSSFGVLRGLRVFRVLGSLFSRHPGNIDYHEKDQIKDKLNKPFPIPGLIFISIRLGKTARKLIDNAWHGPEKNCIETP